MADSLPGAPCSHKPKAIRLEQRRSLNHFSPDEVTATERMLARHGEMSCCCASLATSCLLSDAVCALRHSLKEGGIPEKDMIPSPFIGWRMP